MEVIAMEEICTEKTPLSFCCVCLNTYDYDYIKLECCYQEIHKKCMIMWILSAQNKFINCPTCREDLDLSFNKKVTLGEIVDEINKSDKAIPKSKFIKIVNSLYPDSYFYNNFNTLDNQNQIENENDILFTDNIQGRRISILYNLVLIILMLLVFTGYFYIFSSIPA
jgi:hypothetical protein